MDHATIDYYRRREAAERARAAEADDPAVARVHRELADRYAQRLVTQGAGATALHE